MKTRDDSAIEFLARLSHDLRTPVAAILGYIDNLNDGVRGELLPGQRSDLERMRRAARHLQALIEDVLEYNTLERGNLRLSPAELRLAHVVAELESLARPQLSAKGIALDRGTCARCQATVRADHKRLMQVLTNLLGNAIKFTPPEGRITVRCVVRPAEHLAEVRITDTGPGIPADQLEAIFEPYVRLDTDPPGAQRGVGLGLAISRDLSRAMGGELRVASRPGAGATFTLEIPLA
ncbi:MAG TPA: HAMP domain-containing sensor histidine kinase [Longimicrobium sp.]|nr:HAMP domain-containing sensor histidine kinase [Longimicrobium sp.]